MNPTDLILLKYDAKMRNAFLHASRALKLFKHWLEPIIKIEENYPYRQFVEIILSIFMKMRLLGIPFNDKYRKMKHILC